MVPADWPRVQYGSNLAAGFWTGTGIAEGSLVGVLFLSNEPLELQLPPSNLLHPGNEDALWMPRQAQSKPIQLLTTCREVARLMPL